MVTIQGGSIEGGGYITPGKSEPVFYGDVFFKLCSEPHQRACILTLASFRCLESVLDVLKHETHGNVVVVLK